MDSDKDTYEQKPLKKEFIFVSLMSDSSVIPSVQIPRHNMQNTPRRSKCNGTATLPETSLLDFRVSVTQSLTQTRICSKRPNDTRKRRLKVIASSEEVAKPIDIA